MLVEYDVLVPSSSSSVFTFDLLVLLVFGFSFVEEVPKVVLGKESNSCSSFYIKMLLFKKKN